MGGLVLVHPGLTRLVGLHTGQPVVPHEIAEILLGLQTPFGHKLLLGGVPPVGQVLVFKIGIGIEGGRLLRVSGQPLGLPGHPFRVGVFALISQDGHGQREGQGQGQQQGQECFFHK